MPPARKSIPMPDASTPAFAAPRGARRHLRRALRIAIAIVSVSAAFSAALGHRFWITFVYSISIATACWFFSDVGRMLAARWLQRGVAPAERSWWPGWGPMAAILIVGTALGYSLGNAFANFVLAQPLAVFSRL